jgi:hypothetical protein
VGSKIVDVNKAVTPFSRYAHFVGHSFEASGRWPANQMSHLNPVKDEARSNFGNISKWLGSGMFTCSDVVPRLIDNLTK